MTLPLTVRQRALLVYIRNYEAESGEEKVCGPTIEEMRTFMDYGNRGAVYTMLSKLEGRALVERKSSKQPMRWRPTYAGKLA